MPDQTDRTRLLLLSTAERLFAEEGIAAVSNRPISKEAGQGNNYAVGHHFGGKVGLIEAILDLHDIELQKYRSATLARLGYVTEFRDWVRCLVSPQLEYLASLGAPSYFGRFCAQLDSDPTTAELLYYGLSRSQPLLQILEGFYKALPTLPEAVVSVRDGMTRHLIIQQFADFEHSLETAAAESAELPDWAVHRDIVVDALVGLWLAPVTSHPSPETPTDRPKP